MNTTEQKTYLINFEDNLDVYAERAAEAAKEVDRLKKEIEQLREGGKASATEIEKTNAALRTAQQEYKNAQKNVELATKANKANKDSHEELLRRWQLAQTELKRMGDGYETNEKGVRVLSKAYVDQSKKVADAKNALNKFNLGVHDGRYNVGLYGEALEQAGGQMGGFVGQIVNGVKKIGMAMKALLANPIVLLIAAITAALVGLFKAFKSTDSGATELAARFEQLKAALDVVRQRAVLLLQVFKDLAAGDFKKAWEDIQAAVTGVGDQMRDATAAGYAYQKQLDRLKDSQSNYVSESAKVKNAIAKLEYTAQDRTKSTAERKKALAEAIALGEQEVAKQRDFKFRNLEIEATYLAEKSGLRKEDVIGFIEMTDFEQANASAALKNLRNNNEAKFAEVEKLYADWIDADTKFYDENKRNLSRMTSFIEDEEKKQADAIKAAQEEAKKARSESIALALEQAKGNVDAMKEALKFQYEELIKEEGISETQRQLLKAQYENAIAEIDKEAKEAELKRLEEANKQKEELISRDNAAKFELQRMQNEQDFAMLNQILDAEYEAMKTTAAYEKMTLNEKLLTEQQYTQAKKAISEARIDQMDREKQMVADALGTMADVMGKQTALGKAFAVAQALINTWLAASAVLRDQSVPSIYLKIAMMAVTILAGLNTVRQILKVNVKGGGNSVSGGASASSMAGAAKHVTATPLGASALAAGEGAEKVQASNDTAQRTADAVVSAVASVQPVVTVEDINAKTSEVNKVRVKANV